MPYIEQEKRKTLDKWIWALADSDLDAGDLNYVITRLIDLWCKLERYATYNAAIGVLECVKQEFYRRRVVPYELEKCSKNGDVFEK